MSQIKVDAEDNELRLVSLRFVDLYRLRYLYRLRNST